MLRAWPSVVQLLPRYPVVRDVEADAARYPHQLPVPWLADRAKEAYDLHVEIEKVWGDLPRRGPETVACIGWSHRTPDAAFWEDKRLRVTKDRPTWLGLDGWEKDFGDGTVPSFSALPPEMDHHEHSPIRLVERHVPLAHAAVVADLLERQLKRRAADPGPWRGGRRAPAEHRPGSRRAAPGRRAHPGRRSPSRGRRGCQRAAGIGSAAPGRRRMARQGSAQLGCRAGRL
jgi:hypothetical protein